MGEFARRDLLTGVAGSGFLAATKTAAQSQSSNSSRRPNIIYMHSHDTGRYIQPYGVPVPTPNLHAFASQGVLFRQAFSAAPTCSPSRAALLTGQCAHSSGMLGLAHRGFSLSDGKQHLVHTLRSAGYRSTLAGVQHVAKDPQTIGYDEVLQTKPNHVAQVAPAAVEFLRNAPKQPFFLDVGFFETHREFHKPSPAEDDRFCLPPGPNPDTPQTRRDMAEYKASARVLDTGAGEILRAVESSGLTDNTLVIVTTDHGIAFPAMKCNLTQHGTGVMLILRGPNGISGGKVIDSLISQIDIFPTLCDFLELPAPSWLQGRSFMPILSGKTTEINEAVFSEVTYHAAYEPKRNVRTNRWNYIRNYGEKHSPVLPNCDDGLSKQIWLDKGWRNREVPREEFYDLVFDPEERNNLAADASFRKDLENMRQRLDNWMTRTKDPLLRGPVPAPSGAEVNDPDGLSPKEPARRIS